MSGLTFLNHLQNTLQSYMGNRSVLSHHYKIDAWQPTTKPFLVSTIYTTQKLITIKRDCTWIISYQHFIHSFILIMSYHTRYDLRAFYVQCSWIHWLSFSNTAYNPTVKNQNQSSSVFIGSTDLASGKPTSSSSVLGDLKPQLAVDSNPSPDSHKKSCFFSSFEDHPWWSVDLGLAVAVRSVTVTTRNKAGNRNSMWTSYHSVKYRHTGFVFRCFMICLPVLFRVASINHS